MLKIGYSAVYNYVYREKSLIARICSSPMSHVLSDIQCSWSSFAKMSLMYRVTLVVEYLGWGFRDPPSAKIIVACSFLWALMA